MGTVTIAVPIADAISLSHLGYSYPGDQSPVLNIPAWRVERNEHVFLQGESGSGKSTLLSLLVVPCLYMIFKRQPGKTVV